MQLFSYVRQCLATEMRLIQAAGVDGPAGMVALVGATTGAEVIHKLDLLRRRTQVCLRIFRAGKLLEKQLFRGLQKSIS